MQADAIWLGNIRAAKRNPAVARMAWSPEREARVEGALRAAGREHLIAGLWAPRKRAVLLPPAPPACRWGCLCLHLPLDWAQLAL